MDIIAMIERDHNEILARIDELLHRNEGKRNHESQRQIRELVHVVRLHHKAEEATLFEVLEYADSSLRITCREGYDQHDLLDILLDKLLLLRSDDEDSLTATLNVCRDLLLHHGRAKEEEILCVALKELFSPHELVEMAGIMEDEKRRWDPMLASQLLEPGVPESLLGEDPETRDTIRYINERYAPSCGSRNL